MKQLLLLLAALALLGCAGVALLRLQGGEHMIGTLDLLQFYAAAKVTRSGAYPYGPYALTPVLETIDFRGYPAVEYFHPPWLVPLFLPLSLLPFRFAATVWLLLSVGGALVTGHLIWAVYRKQSFRSIPLTGVCSALLFLPSLSCLYWGQLGLTLVTLYSGILFTLDRQRDRTAGILLALTTVKPQTALLFGVGIAWWGVKNRRWSFLVSAAATFLLLLLIAEFILPGLLRSWRISPESMSYLYNFYGANVTAAARAVMFQLTGSFGTPLLAIIPACAAAVAVYLGGKLREPRRLCPLLLILSVLFAPYGWHHDQTLLLPLQIASVALHFNENGARRTLLLFTTYSAVWGIAAARYGFAQHHFLAFPFGIILLWFFSCRAPAGLHTRDEH